MFFQNKAYETEPDITIASYSSMRNIVGISLGTRLLGIAVVYDGTLSDFRVRTFYGKWNEKKRATIIATIQKAIDQYGIASIVVKTPKPKHSSVSIQELLHDIRLISEQRGINLQVCTVSCLRERYTASARPNKRALIQAIINKYPQHRQLVSRYSRERSNRSAYHVKLFEAIACAEMQSKTE